MLVLAGATGLGGGFLRDVLIDATPPAALADWRYLLVPGRGRADHLRLPPRGRSPRAGRQRLRRRGAGAVLRDRCAQGARLRARAGAGGADGHGHGDRRRDRPRPAGRAGAGGLLERALRNAGPARRDVGRARRRLPGSRSWWWRSPAWRSASACGCWRCGAAGGLRCPVARRVCRGRLGVWAPKRHANVARVAGAVVTHPARHIRMPQGDRTVPPSRRGGIRPVSTVRMSRESRLRLNARCRMRRSTAHIRMPQARLSPSSSPRGRQDPRTPLEVGVGEEPVRVEAVAHRLEVLPAGVRRLEVLRRCGCAACPSAGGRRSPRRIVLDAVEVAAVVGLRVGVEGEVDRVAVLGGREGYVVGRADRGSRPGS